MEAFPFQSNFTGFDDHGNPLYDRAVGAEFIHTRDRLFYKDGVFANPSTNFQVIAGNGMSISIRPGACFIQGVTGIEINATNITIETAEELVSRTDSIVLRCSFVNRLIEVAVKKGTTELTRNGNIWEIKIAEVTVPKMATSISQSNILDTRLNSSVCGVVTHAIGSVDTASIFNQYLDYYNNNVVLAWERFKNDWQTWFSGTRNDWGIWFEQAKAQTLALVNTDFEDMSSKVGHKITCVKDANGKYTEQIINLTTNNVIATRTTEKLANGDYKEVEHWVDTNTRFEVITNAVTKEKTVRSVI